MSGTFPRFQVEFNLCGTLSISFRIARSWIRLVGSQVPQVRALSNQSGKRRDILGCMTKGANCSGTVGISLATPLFYGLPQREEDHNHLFFNCTLSKAVWRMISLKLHVTWPTVPWLQAWEWACDGYTTISQHHSQVLGMALAATVYHLWSERNRRLHLQQHGSVQKLWENICGSVRDRLANLNDGCLLPESIRRQWDIH
ncbi:hypothetical protein OIU84_013058 [Salix udensis]|uniref:Reverse transcriptase zinc-binding domain-containing protein n=1 Tax=Salix udensis TaxID=889485 RepID=A0AAD6JIY8_9ROSI|nr:hypothetical protein OIU84_013058 [Salix udensis]